METNILRSLSVYYALILHILLQILKCALLRQAAGKTHFKLMLSGAVLFESCAIGCLPPSILKISVVICSHGLLAAGVDVFTSTYNNAIF